jgi:hypothetical protein
MHTKQFLITIPAGKRLIAKAVTALEQIKRALETNTIAIVAGTTNAYIAEELLGIIGKKGDFSRNHFFRGVTTAPGKSIKPGGESFLNSDIVIEKGSWQKGKTIFDAAPELGSGDIILKGANAVNALRTQAGILIGNPTLGTSNSILQAVIGKRAELILPIGLEKRVPGDINQIAAMLNHPGASGLRMLPVNGTIITELEAIELLTGATAELIASGGICGAEGGYWLAVSGTKEQLKTVSGLYDLIANEPPFCEG